MAEFWFVSAPLPGHLDWGGYLRTAQALQAAGREVLWVSEPPIGPMVRAAGVPFASIPHSGWLWPPPPPPALGDLPPDEAVRLRYRRALDTWLTVELVTLAVEALLDLARTHGKPVAIATDPFLAAAAMAAEALEVPLVVCGWPALSPPDERNLLPVQRALGQEAQERIAGMARRFGLRGVNFSGGPTPSVQSPLLHISYFSPYWHRADPVPLPQTHFVGGTPALPQGAAPAWLQEIPEEEPLALVTLGTTFTGDLGFFSWAAHAAAQAGLVPLVVLGKAVAPQDKARLKAALPGGTRLLSWVDYDHVFPRLQVAVHHGGMGTTHAAVVHGVPQVVVPHAADQRGQARRVAQAAVGLYLTAHDVRSGQLLLAIRAVVADPRVKETAQKLAQRFAELGGPARAAALLQEAAEPQQHHSGGSGERQ